MNPNEASHHPAAEDWAAYLYDELAPERQRELEEHLRNCPACRSACEQFRATQRTLDHWQLPPHAAATRRSWVPRLKWALAASVLLALGILAGRSTAPKADLAQARAELATAIRGELRQEFHQDLNSALKAADDRAESRLDAMASAWLASRQEDQQTTVSLFKRLDHEHKADLAWIRRDLETVALTSDERFDHAGQALNRLVAYSQPFANPSNEGNPINNNTERNPK